MKRGAGSRELRAKSGELREMGNYSFRFENLEIWKKSIDIGRQLFKIADDLEKKHCFGFNECHGKER